MECFTARTLSESYMFQRHRGCQFLVTILRQLRHRTVSEVARVSSKTTVHCRMASFSEFTVEADRGFLRTFRHTSPAITEVIAIASNLPNIFQQHPVGTGHRIVSNRVLARGFELVLVLETTHSSEPRPRGSLGWSQSLNNAVCSTLVSESRHVSGP